MKKNVAGQKIGAQMITAADGSVFTGAVTVYVTGDAGTQATGSVGSGACTHEGNGYHTYAPAQAETNYDLIAFTFIGTGAVAATVQVYPSFPQTTDPAASIADILADTNELQTDWANGGRLDLILDIIAADTTTDIPALIDSLPTNAELATALGTADDAVLAAIAAIMTTAITESYRADGAAPTPAQALCELLAHMGEASIAGTTKTLKKFDGSTTAETFTLDDATTPTSITRST